MPFWRCARDNRGRCTSWRSGDAHRLANLSGGAATSCGFATQAAVAQGPLGPRRVATPQVRRPGTGAGPGVFSHARLRPLGVAPLHQSLREGSLSIASSRWISGRTAHDARRYRADPATRFSVPRSRTPPPILDANQPGTTGGQGPWITTLRDESLSRASRCTYFLGSPLGLGSCNSVP